MEISVPRVKIIESLEHGLLQVEPLEDKSKENLQGWIKEYLPFVKEKMAQYGGIFFKGFDINTAQDFEDIAKEVDSDLCSSHPFNCSARTWHTKYTCEVQSPNIKQSLVPKGTHNEDAYVGHIPSTIMFCPLEPAVRGGETLVADCRKIYHNLPQHLKEKFLGKKIQNNLIMHDSVFLINGRVPKSQKAINELGKLHNAKEVTRLSENLTQFKFEIPAVIKDHNNDPLWFNLMHIPKYLSYNVYIDTWFAHKYLGGGFRQIKALWAIFLAFFKDLKFLLKNFLNRDPENINFLSEIGDYFFTDGTRLTLKERVQIILAIWKSTSVIQLEKGDILALDNKRLSHGRMPFKGRRVFLAAIGSLVSVEGYQP